MSLQGLSFSRSRPCSVAGGGEFERVKKAVRHYRYEEKCHQVLLIQDGTKKLVGHCRVTSNIVLNSIVARKWQLDSRIFRQIKSLK